MAIQGRGKCPIQAFSRLSLRIPWDPRSPDPAVTCLAFGPWLRAVPWRGDGSSLAALGGSSGTWLRSAGKQEGGDPAWGENTGRSHRMYEIGAESSLCQRRGEALSAGDIWHLSIKRRATFRKPLDVSLTRPPPLARADGSLSRRPHRCSRSGTN